MRLATNAVASVRRLPRVSDRLTLRSWRSWYMQQCTVLLTWASIVSSLSMKTPRSSTFTIGVTDCPQTIRGFFLDLGQLLSSANPDEFCFQGIQLQSIWAPPTIRFPIRRPIDKWQLVEDPKRRNWRRSGCRRHIRGFEFHVPGRFRWRLPYIKRIGEVRGPNPEAHHTITGTVGTSGQHRTRPRSFLLGRRWATEVPAPYTIRHL